MPSKNPSKKALPLKNLLRTLLRSVRLHDPLGVRPMIDISNPTVQQEPGQVTSSSPTQSPPNQDHENIPCQAQDIGGSLARWLGDCDPLNYKEVGCKRSKNTMRAEMIACMIYSEGPEYPEDVMQHFYLKYSRAPKYGTKLGNSLPVSPAQQTTENYPKYSACPQ